MVTRDPKNTRKKILVAATRAFVAFGPAGARVDAIAAEAGVNKRMLYHHFGDKQGLYQAVLAAVTDEQAQLSPQRARLLAWEGLLEPLTRGENSAVSVPLKPAQVGSDIEPLAEPGSKDGMDSQMFALLQTALQVFPHVCGPEVQRLTGLAPNSDAFAAALSRLTEQLQRHIAPVARQQTPKAKVTLRARSTPRRNS